MDKTFFATVSRMKYIERWALMRSSRRESLSEHALDVAMIAHALCTIGNIRLGRHLNAERAALIGLYHDVAEIITGDMPTPVKYGSPDMKKASAAAEKQAQHRLLEKLPRDLRPAWEDILLSPDRQEPDPEAAQSEAVRDEQYLRALVKAADKISALIKCIEEDTAGNREFATAMKTIQESVRKICETYPEAEIFVREFLPPYGSTLDELLR